MLRTFKIRFDERGLLFREGALECVLGPGTHRFFDPLGRISVNVRSVRDVFLTHSDLRMLVRSGRLGPDLEIVEVGDQERAFVWIDGVLRHVLQPGVHALWKVVHRIAIETDTITSLKVLPQHADTIVKSGLLDSEEVQVVEVGDHERVIVNRDGRFHAILGPGRHVLWTGFYRTELEQVDAGHVRFEHQNLEVILRESHASLHLHSYKIEPGQVAVYYLNGEHQGLLAPGTHAFWKGQGNVKLKVFDLHEATLDVSGQEIITADKVSLRLNAVLTFRVADALQAYELPVDHEKALYRDAQLALRAVVGARDLDALLADKDAVANDLLGAVRARAATYGVEVASLGIRDIILPGDMRDLFNKVTEAKKASEASLITRREETAAMRSQANTAKVLDSNPTLMRLRELEVLEKIAGQANLTVVLGEQGLAERMSKLL